MQPKTIKEHRKNVMSHPCIVTGATFDVTLHHCHGGSLRWRGWHTGWALRGVSEALIIPLVGFLHTGTHGIDGGVGIGVDTWEKMHGYQADMIDRMSELCGYDFWELAEEWKPDGKVLVRTRY